MNLTVIYQFSDVHIKQLFNGINNWGGVKTV